MPDRELPTPQPLVAVRKLVDALEGSDTFSGLKVRRVDDLLFVEFPATRADGAIDHYLTKWSFAYYPEWPPDVTFVNTPLSEIEVKFKSLADNNTAGTGVTRASIVCVKGTTTTTTVAPVSENSTADPAKDDFDETFTNLVPDTYTCTVVVDP